MYEFHQNSPYEEYKTESISSIFIKLLLSKKMKGVLKTQHPIHIQLDFRKERRKQNRLSEMVIGDVFLDLVHAQISVVEPLEELPNLLSGGRHTPTLIPEFVPAEGFQDGPSVVAREFEEELEQLTKTLELGILLDTERTEQFAVLVGDVDEVVLVPPKKFCLGCFEQGLEFFLVHAVEIHLFLLIDLKTGKDFLFPTYKKIDKQEK